jgi:hypothetical protein
VENIGQHSLMFVPGSNLPIVAVSLTSGPNLKLARALFLSSVENSFIDTAFFERDARIGHRYDIIYSAGICGPVLADLVIFDSIVLAKWRVQRFDAFIVNLSDLSLAGVTNVMNQEFDLIIGRDFQHLMGLPTIDVPRGRITFSPVELSGDQRR